MLCNKLKPSGPKEEDKNITKICRDNEDSDWQRTNIDEKSSPYGSVQVSFKEKDVIKITLYTTIFVAPFVMTWVLISDPVVVELLRIVRSSQ